MEKDLNSSFPDGEEEIASDYKILRKLGEGTFSEVNLARHRRTNICVAIKKVKASNYSVIDSELLAFLSLDHPNIVRLYDAIPTRDFTHFVMENAPGGTLKSYVDRAGPLSEVEAQRIFAQLVLAVEHCHAKDFAHRDIKPENILLDRYNNVKLCDFGLSVETIPGRFLRRFCGTLLYCTPEMLEGKCYDGKKQDIWCMGLVLFYSVSGNLPFIGGNRFALKQHIMDSCRRKNLLLHTAMSCDMVNIIHKLLSIRPEGRPTIDEVKTHPWVKFVEKPAPPPCTDILQDNTHQRIHILMRILGYNVDHLPEYIRSKSLNRVMATYLILKHGSPWGDSSYIQAGLRFCSGVNMTLVGAPASPSSSRKSILDRSLPAYARSAKPHGQKASAVIQRPSCPMLSFIQPNRDVPEKSSAGDTHKSPPGREAPSGSGSHLKPQNEPHSRGPTDVLDGQNTRNAQQQSASLHDAAPHTAGRAVMLRIYWGWRRLSRRVRRCCRRLCCCVNEDRTETENNVVPVEEKESGAAESQE